MMRINAVALVLLLLMMLPPEKTGRAMQVRSESDDKSASGLESQTEAQTEVSLQAGKWLSSAAERLASESLTKDDKWMVDQLALAMYANQQLSEAKTLAENLANEALSKSIYDQLFRSQIDQILEKSIDATITSDEVAELKELLLAGNHYELLRDSARFEKLIQNQRFDLIDELVSNANGDLQDYVYQEGMYGTQYYKLWNCSRAASVHLRSGTMQSKEAAAELISRFGIDETRDVVRTFIIQDCLRKDREVLPVAEALLEEFETPKKKFWGAFRLGTYFMSKNNLDGAVKYAAIMEDLYDEADPRYRRFLAQLLIGIAQMKMSDGIDAEPEISRALEVGGRDSETIQQLTCMRALSGNFDEVASDPGHAFKSHGVMLDLYNGKYIQYPALRHVPLDLRIDTAIEMAKRFENPFLRAAALCGAADVVSGVMKERFDSFDKIEFHEKPHSDPGRAKELLDLAKQAAESDQSSYDVKGVSNSPIDQSWVFERIVSSYAKAGFLVDAARSLEYVSDEVIERRGFGAPLSIRGRLTRDLAGTMSGTSSRPFTELNGEEVFECLELLTEFDEPGMYLQLHYLAGGFLDHGTESNAMRVVQFAQKSFLTSPGVPLSVTKALIKSKDMARVEAWYAACNKKNQQRLLVDLCNQLNNLKELPGSDLLQFIDQNVSPETRLSNRAINACLLCGFWAHGNEEQADELLVAASEVASSSDVESNPGYENKWMIAQAIRNAERYELPELVMELIPLIDQREYTTHAAMHIGRMMADRNDSHEFMTWLKDQSDLNRALVEIGMACESLGIKLRR